MKDITKKYSNGEITIVWKPATCVHSTICWKAATGLPSVFNPMIRPWINPQGSDSNTMVEQISKCPSGALTFYRNDAQPVPTEVDTESIVEVVQNGPLLVYGNIDVKTADGKIDHKNKVTAFCRCGASSNKPYCDGTHTKIGFSA